MALSNEERIARLEAGYEHLATKAEVAEVRREIATKSDTDVPTGQRNSNRGIDWLFWAAVGIGCGLLAVAAAALILDVLV